NYLMGQDLETTRFELGGDEASGIQLGNDPVQLELSLQLTETIDDTGRGAEHDFSREDVVVRERGHAIRLELAAVGGTGAGASYRRAGQLGLAREERHQALPRLLPRALLGGRGIDRDAEIDARSARMSGVAPRGSVRRELILQIRNLRGAKPDEDRQSHPSRDGERLLARGRHAKRR